MLVITRKPGEEIAIDGVVTIRILSVDRGNVRIGIEAPRTVAVYRRELYHRVEQLNHQALMTAAPSLLKVLRRARLYAVPHLVELPSAPVQPNPPEADE
ncbi:MAG: carbon storage regulator CsrA [Chlorobiota bacterium]